LFRRSDILVGAFKCELELVIREFCRRNYRGPSARLAFEQIALPSVGNIVGCADAWDKMGARSEERPIEVARCVDLRFIHGDTDRTFRQLWDVDLEISHERVDQRLDVFAAKSLCRGLLNSIDHSSTLLFLNSMEVVIME
jgi:hypothetical protein